MKIAVYERHNVTSYSFNAHIVHILENRNTYTNMEARRTLGKQNIRKGREKFFSARKSLSKTVSHFRVFPDRTISVLSHYNE